MNINYAKLAEFCEAYKVNYNVLCMYVREAVALQPPSGGEVRAWMRRWAFDGVDVMALPKKERPRGWQLRGVTEAKCLDDDVPLYTAPPSAPAGVDDALVAGAMEAAADACSHHVVCNEAITAAVEYTLAQQPTAVSAPVGECCVPDAGEPSFVLLGRDPQAPALIEAWAVDRERAEPDSDKPAKARAIAAAMREFKAAHPGKGMPADALAPPSAPAGVVEALVELVAKRRTEADKYADATSGWAMGWHDACHGYSNNIESILAQQPAAVDQAMVERAFTVMRRYDCFFLFSDAILRRLIGEWMTAALDAQPGGSDNDR